MTSEISQKVADNSIVSVVLSGTAEASLQDVYFPVSDENNKNILRLATKDKKAGKTFVMELKFGSKIVYTKDGKDYLCFFKEFYDGKLFLHEIVRGMEFEGSYWDFEDFGELFLWKNKKSKWRFAKRQEVNKGRVLS